MKSVEFIMAKEKQERQEVITEAVLYLLRKNKDINIIIGTDILYDKKEKVYYDINTGEKLTRKIK